MASQPNWFGNFTDPFDGLLRSVNNLAGNHSTQANAGPNRPQARRPPSPVQRKPLSPAGKGTAFVAFIADSAADAAPFRTAGGLDADARWPSSSQRTDGEDTASVATSVVIGTANSKEGERERARRESLSRWAAQRCQDLEEELRWLELEVRPRWAAVSEHARVRIHPSLTPDIRL
jgi:hypothetical protein